MIQHRELNPDTITHPGLTGSGVEQLRTTLTLSQVAAESYA